MATIKINDTDSIRVRFTHRAGTIAVRVTAQRLMPYPEGTIGHEKGWLEDVDLYSEVVMGSEVWEPMSRNKIGALGAIADVKPSQERVDAAIQRAILALVNQP